MFDPDLWSRIRCSIQPRCDALGALEGDIDNKTAACYVLVQTAGGILGVMAANVIFELDAINWSTRRPLRPRTMAIRSHRYLRSPHGHHRSRPLTQRPLGAISVAAYIAGAYFFTSSTSFCQPGSHNRSNLLRYLRRDPTLKCTDVHPLPNHRMPTRSRCHESHSPKMSDNPQCLLCASTTPDVAK